MRSHERAPLRPYGLRVDRTRGRRPDQVPQVSTSKEVCQQGIVFPILFHSVFTARKYLLAAGASLLRLGLDVESDEEDDGDEGAEENGEVGSDGNIHALGNEESRLGSLSEGGERHLGDGAGGAVELGGGDSGASLEAGEGRGGGSEGHGRGDQAHGEDDGGGGLHFDGNLSDRLPGLRNFLRVTAAAGVGKQTRSCF
jgi:hypothetical protein